MRNDVSRQWAMLVPFGSGEELTAQARQVETAGMAGIAAPQVFGSPFVTLGHCAAATTNVPLLSAVVNAFAHSPVEIACSAMDLDRLSGGRFTLGLGASSRLWTQGYYGAREWDHPAARLRETIEVIRLVMALGHTGDLERFEGRFHHHDFHGFGVPPALRPDLPIWIAAFQPGLTRLAAEVADGVSTAMWTADWTRTHGLPTLLDALGAAGRQRRDFHWQVTSYVAVNEDRDEAVRDARATVAIYAARPEMERFFAAQGFGAEARAIQSAGPAAVTDEMAEAFVILGSADDCRKRLEPLWDLADSFLLVPPIWGTPPDRVAAYFAGIADTFYC